MASQSSRRKCVTHPDAFCYICMWRIYTAQATAEHYSEFVKRAYYCYFNVKIGPKVNPGTTQAGSFLRRKFGSMDYRNI